MIAFKDLLNLLIQGLDYLCLPNTDYSLASGSIYLPQVIFSLIILFIVLRLIFHGID